MKEEYKTITEKLVKALKKNQTSDIYKTMKEIAGLPVMAQYYIIKGLKLSRPKSYDLYLQIFEDKRHNEEYRETIRYIIKHVHLQDMDAKRIDYESKDYQSAFDGLGNIQEYVDFIKEEIQK